MQAAYAWSYLQRRRSKTRTRFGRRRSSARSIADVYIYIFIHHQDGSLSIFILEIVLKN